MKIDSFKTEDSDFLPSYLREVLLEELFYSEEVWDQKFFNDLTKKCIKFIRGIYAEMNINIDISEHYNMSVKHDKEGFFVKVVCNNFISALWFSGIFPTDVAVVEKTNVLTYSNKKYSFDKRNNCLVINKF